MNQEIEVRGERIVLRADRSLFWPAKSLLVIADPHFGKADTFRAAGVPVPGSSASMLKRLDASLRHTGAERLLILGDFWHAPQGRTASVIAELSDWRAAHANLQIELVLGNHDRGARSSLHWATNWHESIHEPPFVFTHMPQPSERGYVLAGHIHPGVRLEGRGRERIQLPCFWFSEKVGILPAFGAFTGLKTGKPRDSRCFAIVEDAVVEIDRRPNHDFFTAGHPRSLS